MRISLIAYPVMVAMLLAAVWLSWSWRARARSEERLAVEGARSSIERIVQELSYRATLQEIEINGRGWPVTVDPGWFRGKLPRNPLVPTRNPWLEIADESQHGLSNPRQILVVDGTMASFWYNPANGVVRARIGQPVSDRRALELYNRINGTDLDSIFLPEGPSRSRAGDR